MSYFCYIHNWSSPTEYCPKCVSTSVTVTTDSGTNTLGQVGSIKATTYVDNAAYDQLKREIEIEFEAHTYYKREWESACERYNSMEWELDELKARVDKLVEALKEIILTSGDIVAKKKASKALAAYEGKE